MRPRRSRRTPRSSGSTGSSQARPRSRRRARRGARGPPFATQSPASFASQTRSWSWTAIAAARSETSTRSPWPVSRARTSAARTPVASRKPAVRSAIGIPPARTGTSSPGDACAVRSPARACATRSYAGASASGPEAPKELTRPTTSAGWAAWTSSQASPNRAARSRGKLCRTMSRCARSRDARLEPVCGLEVDDDRALPAVQRDEVAPDTGSDRHHVAVSVTAGRLHFHDVGA